MTKDIASRSLDLIGHRAAISNHAATTVEDAVARGARDFPRVEALPPKGEDILRAIPEKVDIAPLEAYAESAIPLHDALHGLLFAPIWLP